MDLVAVYRTTTPPSAGSARPPPPTQSAPPRTTDPPAQAVASPGSPMGMIEFEDAENPRTAPPSLQYWNLPARGPMVKALKVKALKRPRAPAPAGKSRAGLPSLRKKAMGTIRALTRSMTPPPALRRPPAV